MNAVKPEDTLDHHACLTYEIGITVPRVYDGVLYFLCTLCMKRRHRFAEGDPRNTRATFYVNNPAKVEGA